MLTVCIAAFGALHFIYPVFAPGIPPMQAATPWPLPGHLFWVDLTGAGLLAGAVAMAANGRTGEVTALLGLGMLAFEMGSRTWESSAAF